MQNRDGHCQHPSSGNTQHDALVIMSHGLNWTMDCQKKYLDDKKEKKNI